MFLQRFMRLNVQKIPRARVLWSGPVRCDTGHSRVVTASLPTDVTRPRRPRRASAVSASVHARAHNVRIGRRAAGRAAPLDYMLHYELARHLPYMPVSSASLLFRICLLLVKGLLACAHSLQVRSLQRLGPHQVGLLVELLAPIRDA